MKTQPDEVKGARNRATAKGDAARRATTVRRMADARNAAQTATRVSARTGSAQTAKVLAIARARSMALDLAAPIGSTPKTKYRGNPDLFGRLVSDHDRHRALFAMIEQTRPGMPVRAKLFRELVREIKGHAAAEEQALWSTVLRDPETTEHARHAVAEHKEMDDLLADLAARDITGSAWMRRFGKVKAEYLHHIREEEQEQFVAAEKRMAATDLRHLRSVFNRRKAAEKAGATIEKKIKLKD